MANFINGSINDSIYDMAKNALSPNKIWLKVLMAFMSYWQTP